MLPSTGAAVSFFAAVNTLLVADVDSAATPFAGDGAIAPDRGASKYSLFVLGMVVCGRPVAAVCDTTLVSPVCVALTAAAGLTAVDPTPAGVAALAVPSAVATPALAVISATAPSVMSLWADIA